MLVQIKGKSINEESTVRFKLYWKKVRKVYMKTTKESSWDNYTSSFLSHHLYRFLLYSAKEKVILKSPPEQVTAGQFFLIKKTT